MLRVPLIDTYDNNVLYTGESVEFPPATNNYPNYLYRCKYKIYIDTRDFQVGKKVTVDLTIYGTTGGFPVHKTVSVIASGDYVHAYTGNCEWCKDDGSHANTITVDVEYSSGVTVTNSYTHEITPHGIDSGAAISVSQASPKFGDQIIVTMSKVSGDNRSTWNLFYRVFNKDGWTRVVVASNISGTNYNWTIPKSIANIMTNASDELYLEAEQYDDTWRYNNKPQMIERDSIEINVKPSDDMAPTLTISASDTSTAIANKFGKFVKSKSYVKATIAFTGKYNAAFNNGTLKKGSETLNITKASQTLTFKSVVDATSFNIVGTVADTRNQKTTVTSSQTAYDWEAPKIVSFKVTRCNANGTANPAGAYAKVAYNVSISPCGNKNDKALKVEYKKRSASSWTTQTITMSSYAVNSSVVIAADTESTYDFKLSLTDYFQTSVGEAVLGTAFTLMDFHNSGKGMAIGKVAEEANILDLGIKARARKGIDSDIGWLVLRNKETSNDFETLYFYSNDGTDDVYTGCFIRAYDDDKNGSIFVMRSGGAFIAGGGEFASSYYNDNASSLAGTEQAFFGSDTSVNIITNYNTPANAKQWIFGTSGNMQTPEGGLINGKDITRLAELMNSTDTRARIGVTANEHVLVRTNGKSGNTNIDKAIGARPTGIGLYNYTNSDWDWRINITAGDQINLSNINNNLSSGNITPVYQDHEVTLGGIWAGHVTNNGTDIRFFVPLQKRLLGTAELGIPIRDNTYVNLSVRGPNGYVESMQYLKASDISIYEITAQYSYGVLISLTKTEGVWGNISNNRPVSVQGSVSFSVPYE